MTFDAEVLRAMLRLARGRQAAHDDAVALRVGGTEPAVRAAMRRLEAAGLVEIRAGRSARLTMFGFAIALALIPSRRQRVRRAPMGESRAA
jgi:Mn-dependent DtxR family transcriptional regulator